MKTYRWPTEDKSPGRVLPDGPWMKEIDKAVWIDEATGLDCMIVRNPLGALCGYVGVPEGHLYYNTHHDNMPDDIEVHGGLTYSEFCRPSEAGELYGVCHTAEKGRPEHIWWFGFDCAHYQDLVPGMQQDYITAGLIGLTGSHYRTVPYVQAECAQLAQQLASYA